MSEQNVEVVRAMFAAYGARDVDAVLACALPDIEVRPGVVGGLEGKVYRGREGFRQFIGDIDDIWDRFSVEPKEFRDLGDIVLLLGRVSARGKGSGVELDSATGYVLAMREAQVHRFRSFGDTQEALEAIGLAD